MEEEKNLQEDNLKKAPLAKEPSSFFNENSGITSQENEKKDALQKNDLQAKRDLSNHASENELEITAEMQEYENSEAFDIVGKPKKEQTKDSEEESSEEQNNENQNLDDSADGEAANSNKKKQKRPEPFLDIKENFDSKVQEAEEIAHSNQEEIAQTVEKKVADANKEAKKRTGRFMKYFYAVCLVINLISFAVFLGINSQSKAPFSSLITSTNGWWLVAAFACFFVTMLVEALRYYILILRGTKKSRLNVSYNTASIGKFYDFITPLSTGGQALQITYLIKRKVDPSFATSVPITKYVYNQFCYLLIIVLLFMASGQPEFGDFGATFIGIAAYIGLAWQFLLLFVVFFFSTSKRLAPACTIGVLKFLHKIKIIKDYRETYVKVLRFVHDYQQSFKKFFTDFFSFFVMFVSSIILIVVRCLVPYFIYCAFFGYQQGMLLAICARTIFCELAMGIWVLPGNVIFADVAFMALFKSVFTGGTLFWALLFWRIISYYAYIIQGFITVPITSARDKKFKKPKDVATQNKVAK